MHRTDTTEYHAHAPPSVLSVVPAQSYLVYLCASSPDSRVASLIFRGRYLRYRLSRTLIEQMRSGRYYRKARCTPEVPQISEVPSAERSRLPGWLFSRYHACHATRATIPLHRSQIAAGIIPLSGATKPLCDTAVTPQLDIRPADSTRQVISPPCDTPTV